MSEVGISEKCCVDAAALDADDKDSSDEDERCEV